MITVNLVWINSCRRQIIIDRTSRGIIVFINNYYPSHDLVSLLNKGLFYIYCVVLSFLSFMPTTFRLVFLINYNNNKNNNQVLVLNFFWIGYKFRSG
jgi:hypothetical protein